MLPNRRAHIDYEYVINVKIIPPIIDPLNYIISYAQVRENHRCSYTQIMDVGEDLESSEDLDL